MSAPELFAELHARFPARRTESQKGAFLDFCAAFFRARGYPVRIREEGGGRNLLAGDLGGSELVISAHYDTSSLCRRSFFSTCDGGAGARCRQYFGSLASALTARRKPNPNNANDNTSGLAVLLAIAAARPPRACYLLTDNEERGARGSFAFRAAERGKMATRLFLALDCVGVGTELGAVYYRAHNRGYAETVARYLTGGDYRGFAVQPRGRFATDAENFLRAVCISVK